MTTKPSQVTIPHLGQQFNCCIKSLENLMQVALRYGLAVEDKKKALVVWNDAEDNEIEIYNERAFQTYLKMPQTQLIIKQDVEDPIKIIFDEIKLKNNIVYSFATNYHGLLEDLDGSFGIRFPNDELRIFWTDEFIICDERTFEMFLEKNNRKFTNSTTSLEKTLLVKRMEYGLDIQFQISEESHMIRSRARSYQQLIEDINELFGITFPNEEYHIIFKEDHDKMVICNEEMFAKFLGGFSMGPRQINIQKDESVIKIIIGGIKNTVGFSAAVSYDKLLVNICNMIGKPVQPCKGQNLYWRYASEEKIVINNANFNVFLKYGSKELELYYYDVGSYKGYPIEIVYEGRKYIINPVDDYDEFLNELCVNCGVNTNNSRISYTYHDEELEPREGHIQDRTTFEDFKTRLNRDASPKVMHTIQVQNE